MPSACTYTTILLQHISRNHNHSSRVPSLQSFAAGIRDDDGSVDLPIPTYLIKPVLKKDRIPNDATVAAVVLMAKWFDVELLGLL
mmetsp:Transcript_13764/g.33305  ORF Transcript_13764/g.33305 Transcript_13764/m.33305 type:complete len:85 (+) Transcript_13764:377-631(+)